jgi:ribosome-associated translation inhibitor RaiA
VDNQERLIKDVVEGFRSGERDQPALENTRRCSRHNARVFDILRRARDYNFVLQVNDNPFRVTHVYGEGLLPQDSLCVERFQNPKCDACGKMCKVLYKCRAYQKRQRNHAVFATRGPEEEVNKQYDRLVRRTLEDAIIYLGPECGKKWLGAPREVTEASEGSNGDGGAARQLPTNARTGTTTEVKDLFKECKSILSRKRNREAAEEEVAKVTCRDSVDVAVEASQRMESFRESAEGRVSRGQDLFQELLSYDKGNSAAAADMAKDRATKLEQLYYQVHYGWQPIPTTEWNRFRNACDRALNNADRNGQVKQDWLRSSATAAHPNGQELPDMDRTRDAYNAIQNARARLEGWLNKGVTRLHSAGWLEHAPRDEAAPDACNRGHAFEV